MCSKVLFFVQFKALKGAIGKVSTTRLKWLTVAISLISSSVIKCHQVSSSVVKHHQGSKSIINHWVVPPILPLVWFIIFSSHNSNKLKVQKLQNEDEVWRKDWFYDVVVESLLLQKNNLFFYYWFLKKSFCTAISMDKISHLAPWAPPHKKQAKKFKSCEQFWKAW